MIRKPKKAAKKMQSVSFKSVDEFLDYLPTNELKIVTVLRKIIFDCVPMATEKLTYNVPFYKLNKNICFIWPASILWGDKKSYTGVRLGFSYGNLLKDETGYLDKGDRKQVCYRDFKSLSDIEVELLKSFIFEAAIVDKVN